MAAFEPPVSDPPSGRHHPDRSTAPLTPSDVASRAERNRARRERVMERRFGWLFAVAVAVVTLYLLSRTPWGIALLRRHF